MAKSKATLIKEGKEIGLNLKESMSVYELTHRIEEKKAKIEKEKEKESQKSKGSKSKSKPKIKGEY
jgi:predicted RNA-binding protein with PIN domain